MRLSAAAKLALELIHAIVHGIEQAPVLLEPRRAHPRVRAVARAEHPLEKHARVVLGHQRQRRREPGERAAVGATVAQVAGPQQAVFVGGHLQRGELRVALECLGRDLVHGDGILDIAVRLLHMHAGKIAAASAGVVSAAVAERLRLIAEQARDDDQLGP